MKLLSLLLILNISFADTQKKKLEDFGIKEYEETDGRGIDSLESTAWFDKKTSAGETYGDFLKRDFILLGLSTANFIRLLNQPRSETLWPDEPYGKNIGRHLKEAWTKPPVWDKDSAFTNYIAHPYNGSLYYLSMREKGYSAYKSFMYANYKSLVWEYGIEATIERPSIQDMITTPVGGWLWGEATYQLTKKLRRNGLNTFEKVVLTVFNPIHVLYHGYK